MSYTVTITENNAHERPGGVDKEIFRQTVEALDMQAVFGAINKKPRKPRERKPAKVQP